MTKKYVFHFHISRIDPHERKAAGEERLGNRCVPQGEGLLNPLPDQRGTSIGLEIFVTARN